MNIGPLAADLALLTSVVVEPSNCKQGSRLDSRQGHPHAGDSNPTGPTGK